jgi:hypothetical protein
MKDQIDILLTTVVEKLLKGVWSDRGGFMPISG